MGQIANSSIYAAPFLKKFPFHTYPWRRSPASALIKCYQYFILRVLRRPETSATGYSHRISMSHTAMMWHTLPAKTKKWNTVCMNRRLRRQ